MESLKGFFSPTSKSGSYVANQRNEQGSYAYDDARIKVGQEKQAALQNLSDQYASTIDNAYASYLSSQKDLAASSLGQGYKQAYEQQLNQQFQENLNTVDQSVTQAREQLNTQAQEAENSIISAAQQQVNNFDTAIAKMADYIEYTKSLQNEQGKTYFSDDEYKLDEGTLYNMMLNSDPKGYTSDGAAGQKFSEYVLNHISDAESDWAKWFYNEGGYSQFVNAVNASKSGKSVQEQLTDMAIDTYNEDNSYENWKVVRERQGLSTDRKWYDREKEWNIDIANKEDAMNIRDLEELMNVVEGTNATTRALDVLGLTPKGFGSRFSDFLGALVGKGYEGKVFNKVSTEINIEKYLRELKDYYKKNGTFEGAPKYEQ